MIVKAVKNGNGGTTSRWKWLLFGLVVLTVAIGVIFSFPRSLPLSFNVYWNLTCVNIFQKASVTSEVHEKDLPLLFLEFLNLTTIYDALPIFVLDKTILACINNDAVCHQLTNFTVASFGAFKDSSQCLRQPKALNLNGWRCSDYKNQQFIYKKGNFTVNVAVVELRQNYWYIPAGINQFAAAVLPTNLTVVTLNGFKMLTPLEPQFFEWQLQRSQFLECNKTVAEEFREKHPNVSSAAPIITDDQFLELVYLRDFMYRWRKDPLLFGGTLLGWYRECGLISYTTDLDVTVRASEWDSYFENGLIRDERLSMYWILGKPTDSLEMSVMSKGMKIDIFYLYEEPKSAWVGGMIVWKKAKLRWTYPPLKGICSVDLKNYLFHVPCNVVEYLEADYGQNWYAPVDADKFLWYKSHNNVAEVGKWSISEWHKVYRTTFPGKPSSVASG